MPTQQDITLYPGDATPKDIVLRELLAAPASALTTIYLVQGNATPKDIVLFNVAAQPPGGGGGGVVEADGSASGSCTIGAVGVALWTANGLADGTGLASGIGATIWTRVASSIGAGIASGVGATVYPSVASADGGGAASGVGASVFAGVGSSSGASLVDGLAASVFAAVFVAVGTSGAEAESESGTIVEADGSASGTCIAGAVGETLAPLRPMSGMGGGYRPRRPRARREDQWPIVLEAVGASAGSSSAVAFSDRIITATVVQESSDTEFEELFALLL